MHISTLDEASRVELERILAIEPIALTDSEKAFLRARRDYLTSDQRAVYAEALDTETEAKLSQDADKPSPKPVDESEEAPAPNKAKKSK